MTTFRRNISFLCTYYASSTSPWEKHKTGSPLDHSLDTSRFSFHTEKETDPFLHIDLPRPIHVESLSLRLRDQYTETILPFEILTRRSASEEWHLRGEIQDMATEVEIPVEATVGQVRIVKRGFGFLYLSAVDIWTKTDYFLSLVRSLDNRKDGVTLVYAPWYGLGGGLAVCASAAGAVELTGNRKFLSIVPFSDLIDYPLSCDVDGEDGTFIRDVLGVAPADELLSVQPKARSDHNITMWTESGQPSGQSRPCILITRDHEKTYAAKGEHDWQTLQRLYGRIVPSAMVLDRFEELKNRNDLNDKKLSAALGVHIRHGNGERYYSTRRKMWGVKPPSRNAIVSAIEAALKNADDIESIIVCSDTPSVQEILTEAFPAQNIVFVSHTIQDTGAGCNHLEHVFDETLPRKPVDRKDDDIQSFAEILLLSQCARLCGGSSYFFNAAVGFSTIAPELVFFLDNTDRYARLSPTARPLLETELPQGKELAIHIRQAGLRIDGLFLDQDSSGKKLVFSYFDKLLKSGSLEGLKDYITDDEFRSDIWQLRLY